MKIAPTLDVARIRQDFPMLAKADKEGRRFAFLDTAASSQTPIQVLEAQDAYYFNYRANVHRGMYNASHVATEHYEAVRRKVADFLRADEQEIVFTRGTTESLNLLASSLGRTLGPGDEVVLSAMEHHANLVPWQQIGIDRGFAVKFIPMKKVGFELDLDAAKALIGPKTKIVSFTYVSNVLGTVAPAAELIALAHAQGALAVVDAAQAVGHVAIDVRKLDCDFLAFSGHKMLGPTGTGVLYGKKKLLDGMHPFLYGGDMIREVFWDRSTWNEAPWKFEAGTPNVGGVIGLGAAVDYVKLTGIDRIAAHEEALTRRAIEKLSAIPGLEIIGPAADAVRTSVVSFEVKGIHPHDMATILDAEGVAVRGGHHCAMPLLRELGYVNGTTRASFALYNAETDVDALVAGVEKAKRIFRIS